MSFILSLNISQHGLVNRFRHAAVQFASQACNQKRVGRLCANGRLFANGNLDGSIDRKDLYTIWPSHSLNVNQSCMMSASADWCGLLLGHLGRKLWWLDQPSVPRSGIPWEGAHLTGLCTYPVICNYLLCNFYECSLTHFAGPRPICGDSP